MNGLVLATRLLDWYATHARQLPWRMTRDPYAIWVSEVMLQQTQVATVIPYWRRWMLRLPTVASLAAAPESEVLRLWEGLGYYRRARNLQLAARQIVQRHGGNFPRQISSILELPGVGRYTAGAISSVAFGDPEPIVDGNVARVMSRLEAVRGDPAQSAVNRRMWDWAGQLVRAAAGLGRPDACSNLNQALMELGALVCTPRDPQCARCPVATECRAWSMGKVGSFPTPKVLPKATPRHFVVIVARHAGCYCVRRRPEDAVNGGLWEFPNIEVDSPAADAAWVVRRLFGVRRSEPERWCQVRHAITRYRITQHVHRVLFGDVRPGGKSVGEWLELPALDGLAFSSAHRRIVHRLREDHEPAD